MSAVDLVAQLAAAGTPPELLAEVAQQLFSGEAAQAAIDARRANDRERKARTSREVTGMHVTGAEIPSEPLPPLPPLKVSPNPIKNTPPISPKPTTELRARRLPEDWMPGPLTGKALAMVERWQPGEIEREIAKFRNYWMGKAGKDACKTDWQRTWINWLISADERKPQHGRSGQQPTGIGRTEAAAIAALGG